MLLFYGIAGAQEAPSRIGPALKEILFRHNEGLALEQESIPCLLKQSLGSFSTRVLSIRQLKQLSEQGGFYSLRLAARGGASLDVSAVETRVDQVRAGVLGQIYTGEGVIIGIIDSGIDWHNDDFRNENGNTRIITIWDQTVNDSLRYPSGYSYGSEFSTEDIQAALDDPNTNPVGGSDIWGHGTHVAGIAAGNGRATGNGQPSGTYVGVAPKAKLIIVKGGDRQFYQNRILDGARYIFAKADELGMPAVVNISVGLTHFGPHDGTSDLEQSLDDLLWDSGRAVVVAAGNDGDKAIHFRGETSVAQGVKTEIVFEIPGNTAGTEDYLSWDVWAPGSAVLPLSVITPNGMTLGPVPSDSAAFWLTDEGYVYIDNSSGGPEENDQREIWLRIADTRINGGLDDNLAAGSWKLVFGGSSGGWFHGWLYDSSLNSRITDGAEYSVLLPEPANAHFVLTAASYISRSQWPSLYEDPWGPAQLTIGDISSFSSPGPTRDGRSKPEVAAPGEYILSSLAGTAAWPDPYLVASDSSHRAWSGTSMAAPQVTGAVALLFEMNPELISSQIKSLLIQTCRKDEFTGQDLWHASWGYGKLDVLELLRQTGVPQEPEQKNPVSYELSQAFPNPFNSACRIEYTVPRRGSVTIRVLDVRGREVAVLMHQIKENGHYFISWDGRTHLEGIRAAASILSP